MSFSNDYKFYGTSPIDASVYFAGKPIKKISPGFDADKAEFFGEYTGIGTTVGSVVPGVGNLIGGAVGLLADVGVAIWGGGPPEDTSDVGYQNALAQREGMRMARAQEAAKQASIKSSVVEKKKQTNLIVIGIVICVVLIGGALMIFSKK
jgi:hypothetical protein